MAVGALLATATRRDTFWQGRGTAWHLWGRGDPVVLLHGGSGSWTHWFGNIEALVGAGRQVLVPDMPGCGDSDPPAAGHDADALVDPLLAGLGDLLEGRPYDLVGFSFGSLVACLIATRRPAALKRLVIVGAPVLPQLQRPVRLLEWRHLPEHAQRAAHHANLAALMLHQPERITDLVIDLHIANVTRDRLRRRRLTRTDVMARALLQVRCPLVAIYGQHDVLYRDQLDVVETALDALPALQWRIAIEGAGHWVQFEAHDAFNQALARALDAPLAACDMT